MKHSEWQKSCEPKKMLEFAVPLVPPRMTVSALLAMTESVLHLAEGDMAERLVAVGKAYLDGEATKEDVKALTWESPVHEMYNAMPVGPAKYVLWASRLAAESCMATSPPEYRAVHTAGSVAGAAFGDSSYAPGDGSATYDQYRLTATASSYEWAASVCGRIADIVREHIPWCAVSDGLAMRDG